MYLKNTTYLLLLILITGCGTTAFIQKVTPVDTAMSQYKHAYVLVHAKDNTVKESKGFDVSQRELRKHFISNLTTTNRFLTISNINPEKAKQSSLLIDLIIEDSNYLSGFSSYMWGVMSGNARLKVLAKISDANSGKVISEIRSGSHTASSGGIFRGSSSSLITDISEKLALEIASYK